MIRAILIFFLVISMSLEGVSQVKLDSLNRKATFAVGLNFADLVGNYGGITFFHQVNVWKWLAVEIGGGPVFFPENWTYHVHPDRYDSEPPPFIFDFADDDRSIEPYDESGYKLYSEIKCYYPDESHRLYFGIGASYIHSELTVKHAEKIVLDDLEQWETTYYRTVATEVESTVKSYYFQLGYQYRFWKGRMYAESGFKIRHIDRELTPEKIVPENEVVLTSNFYKNWGDYPRSLGIDLKIGFVF